jgi:hypothetical protein
LSFEFFLQIPFTGESVEEYAITSCWGSRTGSARNRAALTTEKIAVLAHPLDRCPTPHLRAPFLQQRCVPELSSRRVLRFQIGQTRFVVLPGLHIEVELHLLFKFAI